MKQAVEVSQAAAFQDGDTSTQRMNFSLRQAPAGLELMILLPSPPCVLPRLGLSNGWDFALLFL